MRALLHFDFLGLDGSAVQFRSSASAHGTGNCRCRHGRCTRHPHVARHSYRDPDTVEAANNCRDPAGWSSSSTRKASAADCSTASC